MERSSPSKPPNIANTAPLPSDVHARNTRLSPTRCAKSSSENQRPSTLMTAPHAPHRVQFPVTPPRSRGGSHPREREPTPPGEGRIFRRHSKRQSFNGATILPPLKAHREHRKERIVIVDLPADAPDPPNALHANLYSAELACHTTFHRRRDAETRAWTTNHRR